MMTQLKQIRNEQEEQTRQGQNIQNTMREEMNEEFKKLNQLLINSGPKSSKQSPIKISENNN